MRALVQKKSVEYFAVSFRFWTSSALINTLVCMTEPYLVRKAKLPYFKLNSEIYKSIPCLQTKNNAVVKCDNDNCDNLKNATLNLINDTEVATKTGNKEIIKSLRGNNCKYVCLFF